MNATVSIERVNPPANSDSILDAVRRAVLASTEGKPLTRKGDTVLLKPNIFCPSPAPLTTDPRVVAAMATVAFELGAGEVLVGEGRSISTAKYRKANNTTRLCSQAIGMTQACEAAGAKMLFFEEAERIEVEVPGGLVLKKVNVPKIALDADVFIDMPVLKIHSLTLVTLGIKNLHGVISDDDKLFGHSYPALPEKLTDFLRVRKPDLTVMDAVVGLEGDHAEEGTAVPMNLIFAGRDVVAVDAVACAVIGFDPMEVDINRVAHEQALGTADLSSIAVLGESVESVRRPFRRPDIILDRELFPGLTIVAGEYCRSCEYYIRRGLDKLKDAGWFDGSNRLTIVLGKEPEVPDDIPGKVIMLGDCCLGSKSITRLRNHLLLDGRLQMVYQCPPMQFRIRALDLVED
ncbi:MAG: DUF362 domain-containing protein [Armatimonadetes bacterium]|nr:DUF362 domain-containing protein [Armatimonadota bacterium]